MNGEAARGLIVGDSSPHPFDPRPSVARFLGRGFDVSVACEFVPIVTSRPSPVRADVPTVRRNPPKPGSSAPKAHHPDELVQVEALLAHFGQLEAQFQQVREGLAQSHRLATLGTIASVIAHEYNNILTPVISYAQLALAQPEDAALTRKALEKALAGAERAAKISASLLGFAREADEKHAARLPAVVDDTIACMARAPEKDGVRVAIDVPDVQVAISATNLQQVLLNLVLNARHAMRRRGGHIKINGRKQGAMLVLDVIDDGPGVPAEIRERLFEPFVTAPTPQDGDGAARPRGTGLGLMICRDLIRNAGGTIECETEEGKGTTFHITLPLADDLFTPPSN